MKSLKEAMAEGYGLTSWRGNGLPEGYFPHWEYNVYGNYMEDRFQKMFISGSGYELDFKGAAVHSSAMFGYNFFHWINEDNMVNINLSQENSINLLQSNNPIQLSYVGFEARIKTLRTSNTPANIDIVLLSKDKKTLVLIESKLLEYNTHTAFNISDSYSKPSCYYENEGDDWGKVIKDCKDKFQEKTQYYEGIKQNICHLIAIRNLAHGKRSAIEWFIKQNQAIEFDISKVQQFHFLNAIFDPHPKFEHEKNAFDNYKKLHKEFLNILNAREVLPNNISVGFITYSDLWENFKESMPNDISAFLERRYMRFANPSCLR